MSFTRFRSLPTELKLAILGQADAMALTQLLKSNKELRELSQYVINEKVSALTGSTSRSEEETASSSHFSAAVSGLNAIASSTSESSVTSIDSAAAQPESESLTPSQSSDEMLISFFSPQSAENNVELYEAKCMSNIPSEAISRSSSTDNLVEKVDKEAMVSEANLNQIDELLNNVNKSEEFYSTSRYNHGSGQMFSCFELGSLVKTRDPLTKKITLHNREKTSGLPLHLLVDDESSTIKLTIQISLSNNQILERKETFRTEWADDKPQCLISKGKRFGLSFKLSKGEELQPRSPYDYEVLTNYYLDIDNFVINNCYLLHCVETTQSA